LDIAASLTLPSSAMFDQHAHGESIYSIIPPKEVKQEKLPMHRSSHNPKIPPSGSTFGQAQTSHPISTNIAGECNAKVVADRGNRTMGKRAGSHANDPRNFTKAGAQASKVATLTQVKKENPELLQPSKLKTKHRPDVPRKGEEPVMNLVTSKNFIVANAVETILAAPKKVSQGAKDYLNKEDYGRVPKYLTHIKQDIDAEYDYINQLQQAEVEANRSQVQQLGEDERMRLIDGLKSRWESVNTEYQAGTHITKLDTIGKIKRKEKYEAELSQIEKDIERLNRRNIMVDQSYY